MYESSNVGGNSILSKSCKTSILALMFCALLKHLNITAIAPARRVLSKDKGNP